MNNFKKMKKLIITLKNKKILNLQLMKTKKILLLRNKIWILLIKFI